MSDQKGDLELFKTQNRAYLNFITHLQSLLTEANEQYEGIRVSKRTPGYTKVVIKSGNTEVPFVYRNRDLYIIGVIVGQKCYMDSKALSEVNDRPALNKVISPATAESLSTDFSYKNIMPKGEQTEIRIAELGYHLQKLTKIGDQKERKKVLENNLSPFVILFAEAVRFPVIAKAAQDAFQAVAGTLKLSQDVVPPKLAVQANVIRIHTLLLIWGRLSTCVKTLFVDNQCVATVEVWEKPSREHPEGFLLPRETKIDKESLKVLLGVANSYSFSKFNVPRARGKREASFDLLQPVQQRLTLSHRPGNLLGYDDYLQQPSGSTSAISAVLPSLDISGALQLLTLGVLHLTRRRLHQTEADQTIDNSKEASAIAADLTDRVVCFIRSAGPSKAEIEFEVQMELQRQLAAALFRGVHIDGIVSSFIEKYSPDNMDTMDIESATAMLSQAFDDGNCFQ